MRRDSALRGPSSLTGSGERVRLPDGLVFGTFVRRRNRFAADVLVDGCEAVAHVPNSGRMTELLVNGATVLLEPAPRDTTRRTEFSLVLVRHQGRWVGVDSRLPPALLIEAWRRGLLDALGCYGHVRREVRYGGSRLDLLFEGPAGLCYVETKSVNLVVGGVALFPDAPTARGVRHLGELVRAVDSGHRAAAVFVIQRDDAVALSPHDEADPQFADALRRAVAQGVEAYAIACDVTSTVITPRRLVPVRLLSQAPHDGGTQGR